MNSYQKTVDINFERQEGSRNLTAAIDSTKMTKDKAETLFRLLEQLGFFNYG
jgi:hypothetical protein